jgi:hypothetical protein
MVTDFPEPLCRDAKSRPDPDSDEHASTTSPTMMPTINPMMTPAVPPPRQLSDCPD